MEDFKKKGLFIDLRDLATAMINRGFVPDGDNWDGWISSFLEELDARYAVEGNVIETMREMLSADHVAGVGDVNLQALIDSARNRHTEQMRLKNEQRDINLRDLTPYVSAYCSLAYDLMKKADVVPGDISREQFMADAMDREKRFSEDGALWRQPYGWLHFNQDVSIWIINEHCGRFQPFPNLAYGMLTGNSTYTTIEEHIEKMVEKLINGGWL